jgi:hypothetical protein
MAKDLVLRVGPDRTSLTIPGFLEQIGENLSRVRTR